MTRNGPVTKNKSDQMAFYLNKKEVIAARKAGQNNPELPETITPPGTAFA